MESKNGTAFFQSDDPADRTSADRQPRDADIREKMRDEQHLINGAFAGTVAAVLGAMIWAVITALVKYQIAWMSVGMGFLVGWAVRRWGGGIDRQFGILGALLSLAGCLLGNFLSILFLLTQNNLEYLPSLFRQFLSHPDLIVRFMTLAFSPIDLLFYGLGIYYGYKYSILPIPNSATDGREEKPAAESKAKQQTPGTVRLILIGIFTLFLLGLVAIGVAGPH